MPALQGFTTVQASTTAPELTELLDRVERLRRLSLLRPEEMPVAPWIRALGGRELMPGLTVAERRFPLWYRHDGQDLASLARPAAEACLPLSTAPLPERIGFLSLLPVVLDDGGTRQCLATWGRLEDTHFVIRQGVAAGPGAEVALLRWLAREMGKVDVVASTGGRGGHAGLVAACLRHGLDGMSSPAWVESSRPAPAGRFSWRGLQAASASRAADLYRRQRDSVLSLATRLGAEGV